MQHATTWGRLLLLVVVLGLAGSAYGQRTVTLRLNTATIPDTISTNGLIKVMGAVDEGSGNTVPFTLPDGNIISWDTSGANASTLDVENVGGDYWHISFQVPNAATTTFKFFSAQAEADGIGGWEADPNPTIGPGTADSTLDLHYFESQANYKGSSGDRGPYDWRPFESKEDSVAVLFRVAMFGDEARSDGYDPAANPPDQFVGVRGDSIGGGVIDWGTSNVVLERESSTSGQPGFNMYSGVGYYPLSAAGETQNYKFVLERGASVGWEEGNVSGNRTFTVPAQDTTLHWVFYGNTPPVATQPVESLALFTVDLSPFETIGLFDRARGDTLWVYGSFNGWQDCPNTNPDLCLMTAVPGENQFELAAPLLEVPGSNQDFKYFLDFNDVTFRETFGVDPPSGWEEGHRTGNDRRFVYQDAPLQDLGIAYFNDVTPRNVIPDGESVVVTFSVDMSPAIDNVARPFDPAADSVFLRIADPIWAFTQGISFPGEDFPLTPSFLEDPDGDLVYTGTMVVEGPTYSAITYRYMYGAGNDRIEESGSDTKTPGRNRVNYIRPEGDTWPSSYALPAHTFHLEPGPLPFDTNPAFEQTSVEEIDGEIPSEIALGQNYPNPFNPTTAFEYSLTAAQHVTVRVYDVLGREVATLVEGMQPAATYRVTFDAGHLASGLYLYRLETANRVLSKTMMLLK